MILSELLEGEIGDSYSVRIPTFVLVSKKNRKAVNLNIYRNLHHHHLNAQKKNFTDEVLPLLKDKPRAEKVWIHYEIFAPRNGRLDTMNVGSIADKYFSDTLVEAGKIPDDNYEHLVLSTFSFGGVCPMDGHAIATVNILKEESQPMRVLLDQEDIQNALDAFVKTMNLPGATGVELSVTDDGDIEAEVLMGEAKPKNKGGRPRGSKNKTTPKPAPVKEEESDVDEAGDDDSEGSSDQSDSGGTESSTDSAEAGKKEPAKTSSEGKTQKGNLFGDEEESQSSDSQPEAETTKEDGGSKLTSKKKSSIFDVD